MKYHVLLLEDLLNQGKKGDLVHVAPGFARNFLLPQGKALLASESTLKLRERLKQERAEQASRDRAFSEELAAKLTGQMFSVVVKVDPDGHMYGSVAISDIVEILEKGGFTIDKRFVALNHPIRQLGSYQIALKLPEGVEISVGLEVKPDRVLKKAEPKAVAEALMPEAAVEDEEAKEEGEKPSKKKK